MIHLSETETVALAAPEPCDNGRGVGDNRRDWKYYDERLAAIDRNDVENIMERGRVLIEAKKELEPGSYEATVKRHFDLSYARKLRIIAAHPVIANRSHANALPPSAETLYSLTRLPNDVLIAKLSDGSITPKLQRKEIAAWRERKVEVGGKSIERKRKPSLAARLQAAEAEIVRLNEARPEADGRSQFDLETTGAESIGKIIVQTWRTQPSRIETLIRTLSAELKDLRALTKAARPKAKRRGRRSVSAGAQP